MLSVSACLDEAEDDLDDDPEPEARHSQEKESFGGVALYPASDAARPTPDVADTPAVLAFNVDLIRVPAVLALPLHGTYIHSPLRELYNLFVHIASLSRPASGPVFDWLTKIP